MTALSPDTVDSYLRRIGITERPAVTLDSLALLQRAHMTHVPFENLDVFAGTGVRTDLDWSVPKIVDRNRGGWCFELNGAFGALLDALDFPVTRLGAAVLLDGPTTIIDHLTLEVMLDVPYLVDVGFGESFIRPLLLNERGPQDGGEGTYQFIDSDEGLTLTRLDEAGVPVPQYRFRRVAHELQEFDAASDRLQSDPDAHWSQKPFATRIRDGGPERITLLKDRLKVADGDRVDLTPVGVDDWADALREHFSMTAPVEVVDKL